ncbi:efflux RND transporter periplasmic adaptor subunit [Paenibacillaceae bacterium]|nr:efflux RND transporter periplasmic adaptor subunit [Paenibacillaceae bacterium]
MKKWAFALAGMGLAAIIVYFGYPYVFKEKPAVAAPVRTAKVIKGDLEVTVLGSGTVSAVNTKGVTAVIEGQLAAPVVKTGDIVEEGQLIASYEPTDLSKDIENLETSIAKQNMDYERLKKKYTEASDNERENIGYEIEAIKLDRAANNKSLAELKEEHDKVTTINAPISGKVTAVNVAETGQRVQSGTAVVTITDYSLLQSVIQVDELDVTKVKAGQKASVLLDALEELDIEGTVASIADEGVASNGVALFDVTIEFAAQEGIRTGMSASAEITVNSRENVLMVPIEAIREAGAQKMVLLAAASNQTDTTQLSPEGAGERSGEGRSQAADSDREAMPQGQLDGQRADRQVMPQGELEGQRADRQVTPQGELEGQRADREVMPQGQLDGQRTGRTGANTAAGNAEAGRVAIVTVGASNETYIEIVSGLSEGEEVILPSAVVSNTQNATMGFPGGGSGGFSGGVSGGGAGGGGMRFGTGGSGMQRGG